MPHTSCPSCPLGHTDGYREFSFTFPHVVREKMASLLADGYKLVIVSNQGPLEHATPERPDLIGRDVAAHTAAEKQKQWAEKLIEVCQLLNSGALGQSVPLPLQVYGLLDGSKESGFYKPCHSWWKMFAEHFNGETKQLDCEASYYVGDAGGRLRGDTTNPWQNGEVST